MNRRNFLKMAGTGLLVPLAPAIVRAENIMPVRSIDRITVEQVSFDYDPARKIITVADAPYPADHRSLNDAVRHARSGDIIEVLWGHETTEPVVIDKPGMTIKGATISVPPPFDAVTYRNCHIRHHGEE